MIASKAAVPNGLMNAIRRSTGASIVTRHSLQAGLEARSVGAERRRVDHRLAAADQVRDEPAGRRPGAVAEDVAGGDDQVVVARRPADERQRVARERQDAGPRPREPGAAQLRQGRQHALGDERDAGEVRLPVETGVVHRDAEQVRAVGGLAGRLEERQAESLVRAPSRTAPRRSRRAP